MSAASTWFLLVVTVAPQCGNKLGRLQRLTTNEMEYWIFCVVRTAITHVKVAAQYQHSVVGGQRNVDIKHSDCIARWAVNGVCAIRSLFVDLLIWLQNHLCTISAAASVGCRHFEFAVLSEHRSVADESHPILLSSPRHRWKQDQEILRKHLVFTHCWSCVWR